MMNDHNDQQSHPAVAPCYRLKVKGTLEPCWSDRLGGLSLENEAGFTILTGEIPDQSALHGLIMQIRDLGMPLILVEEMDKSKQECVHE